MYSVGLQDSRCSSLTESAYSHLPANFLCDDFALACARLAADLYCTHPTFWGRIVKARLLYVHPFDLQASSAVEETPQSFCSLTSLLQTTDVCAERESFPE